MKIEAISLKKLLEPYKMKPIITIKNQHFYYAEIAELAEFLSNKKCAIILEEDKLIALVESKLQIDAEHINQLIIISENLNNCMDLIVGKDVFVMSAQNFEEAVRLAVNSSELNENVICILNMDTVRFKESIELIMV